MKPTKENKAKAIALLRAMAEEADWSPDALVDPENAAERHKLNLTHREIDEMETYLISLGLLDSDHATLSGIGLTQRGIDVAHGEAEEAFAGEHDLKRVLMAFHVASQHSEVHMGSKFITNITGSTIGAIATGDQAVATGHVTVHERPLTQAQHLEHLKTAKKALVDDEERLDAAVHEALERFLKRAREVQVETRPIEEVQAEMEGILDRVWAEHSGKALPQELKVTEALSKSPAMVGVAKKLLGA